jgi:ParB family chromosome partitioning protein
VACSFATRHEIGRITNTLRLLKLPENVQTLVRSGKVGACHARVLIGRSDAEELA